MKRIQIKINSCFQRIRETKIGLNFIGIRNLKNLHVTLKILNNIIKPIANYLLKIVPKFSIDQKFQKL